jgi:hypothetical protein
VFHQVSGHSPSPRLLARLSIVVIKPSRLEKTGESGLNDTKCSGVGCPFGWGVVSWATASLAGALPPGPRWASPMYPGHRCDRITGRFRRQCPLHTAGRAAPSQWVGRGRGCRLATAGALLLRAGGGVRQLIASSRCSCQPSTSCVPSGGTRVQGRGSVPAPASQPRRQASPMASRRSRGAG